MKMMDFAGISRRSVLSLLSTATMGALIGCAVRSEPNTPYLTPTGTRWQTRSVRSETDGLNIVFHEAGEGPPLLIVHGGGSTAEPYTALGNLLTSEFRVARMERRNYTVSGDRSSPRTWEQEVGDVAAVVAALGGRSHLFGHSAGGLVSLHVARRRPHLIHKLALYEPPLLGGGGSVVAVKQRVEELIAQGRHDDAIVLLYGHFVGLPEPVVRETVRQRGAAIYPLLPGAVADMEALTTLDTDPQHYSGIALETLMLVGENSSEHPLRDSSTALAQVLPQARVITLTGQGHSAQYTAPQLIADAIRPFFLSA